MLLSPQAIKVVEYLNSASHIPTVAEIGNALGMSTSATWRALRGLRNQGIRFEGVANIAKLGLIEVLLIYKSRIPLSRVPRKLLRSFIRTLEGVTFLKYVTKVHEVESAVNHVITVVGAEPSEVYVMDAVVPPRYVFTHIARGAPDRLYVRELLAVASAPQPAWRPYTAGRADPIDIAIVNRLEEDALTKMKEVYEAMKSSSGSPSYQTVLRHFREHVLGREVVAGLRPTIESCIERVTASTRKLLLLYGPPSSLLRGVRAVTAIPAFTQAHLNTKEGVAYATSVLPLELVPKVAEFLGILESRGLVREWMILEIEQVSELRFPIPEALGAMSVSELLAKDDL